MNKIVREHYPVAKLPDDLRVAFASEGQVTVTVEQAAAPGPEISLAEIYALADGSHLSKPEIDEILEARRNEWHR